MLRFRLILAWLLLAALPLQGWAAATMLYCGPAQRDAVHAKADLPEAAVSHHDMRAAHHLMQSAHTPHHMGAIDEGAADSGSTEGVAQPVADASHTCGVCAACCHGVALAQTLHWPTITAAPGANLAEPLVTVVAHPSPVPDKPPRA